VEERGWNEWMGGNGSKGWKRGGGMNGWETMGARGGREWVYYCILYYLPYHDTGSRHSTTRAERPFQSISSLTNEKSEVSPSYYSFDCTTTFWRVLEFLSVTYHPVQPPNFTPACDTQCSTLFSDLIAYEHRNDT
jgi:hypothetical protein